MFVVPGVLSGRSVVLTGKVLGLERRILCAKISSAGGTVHDAVHASVDVLVAQGYPSAHKQTVKVKTAQSLGVPIIGEAALEQVLLNKVTLDQALGRAPSPSTSQNALTADDAPGRAPKRTRAKGMSRAMSKDLTMLAKAIASSECKAEF